MRVTKARLDAYREELASLGDEAATYVEGYLAALREEFPGMSVAELRDEAVAAVGDALNAFGDQAADLACDLLDEIAAAHGAAVDTAIYDVVPADMVDGAVRFRARDIVDGKLASFDRNVADLTRYYIKRSAFENMERNCERNDLRYARVPSGTEACAFCFMLSSRGFVYRSERTASGEHGYHDNCDCVAVPGFEDARGELGTQIEGYDPDGKRRRWNACEDTLGGAEAARAEWEAMDAKARAKYKGESDAERYARFRRARVMREVETRDWRWLNTGEVPKVEFETDDLRDEVMRVRSHEYDSAMLLSRNGFKCRFVNDREETVNPITGLLEYVGLPDLEGGIELKSLKTAKGVGAIDRHLRDAAGKKGLKVCVIDNSLEVLDDDDAVKAIMEKMVKRHVRNVLYIDSSEFIRRIEK